MYRVALRSVDREYEIDHWFTYTTTLDEAKKLADKHVGRTLSWKNDGSAQQAPVGRNVSYFIERYDPTASTDPVPKPDKRPARV